MRAARVLLLVLATIGSAGAEDYLNCRFVPGWEQSGARRAYTADNLYEYKDGGAEGYLVYGFAGMRGIDCKAGTVTVAIDVSEMGDADLAYGMFAANREVSKPIAKIGMGGQMLAQSVSFAKGKYYVEIVETDGNPASNLTDTLTSVAKEMEKMLEGRETPPAEMGWFVQDGMDSARVVPESVLGLRILKHGYVAKYELGQAFVVVEDSAESAQAVMKKLREKFDGAVAVTMADEGFQVKAPYLDGLCVFRKGRYLAGYANLPDAAGAAVRAAKLAERIR